MNKEQDIKDKDKALHIGRVIKRFMYVIPFFGMFFIKNKEWTSMDFNLYFFYQWCMSFIAPFISMFFLKWMNVL